MFDKLKEIYLREQFNPSYLGIFINQFYFSRKGLHKGISSLIIHLNGKILDIGCGKKPYQSLCNASEYIGLELDTPENRLNKKADFFYDGKIMPFKENYFDSIICNQVFEHIFNPNQFLSEVNRITKINGTFLLTVPFIWDEHEQPCDYARYSSFGLKYILELHGFEIIEHKKTLNDASVIFQLINCYIYKIICKNIYINILMTFILISPVNIVGIIFSKLLPKNNDLYLDNVILAKKVKNV